MALLKGMSQRTIRGHLSRALQGREIEDLVLRAEIVEVEPANGYRKHETTGRLFVEVTIAPK